MKTIWLIRVRERTRRAAMLTRVVRAIADTEWPDAAIRISLFAGTEETEDAPADLLISCWSELSIGLPSPLAAALADHCDITMLTIDERVRKDIKGWRGTGSVEGVSLLAFCTPRAGQLRHQILRHWTEHVALALPIHHGATRYVQNVILPGSSDGSPWFGIAELQFPDRERIPGYLFRSETDVATINEDVSDFVASSSTIFAEERVLKA